ncbi:hypothetical protein F4780DRAFT_784986 [Xylariomycetidae sp. FL0641]|nr:hypothetical protein F4780DRAFT_784986 [Xylariomycetidae sp. FL0641]
MSYTFKTKCKIEGCKFEGQHTIPVYLEGFNFDLFSDAEEEVVCEAHGGSGEYETYKLDEMKKKAEEEMQKKIEEGEQKQIEEAEKQKEMEEAEKRKEMEEAEKRKEMEE